MKHEKITTLRFLPLHSLSCFFFVFFFAVSTHKGRTKSDSGTMKLVSHVRQAVTHFVFLAF